MGKNLFIVLTGSIIFLLVIDLFEIWYRRFLKNYVASEHIARTILQVKWVLLAFLFWNALYRYFLPEEFTISHLLFALFVYSLRGLAAETFRRDD
ncbi:MAG: hypothetical protein DWQ10_18230 [Calditrichaeota bacterium]|nr:MAG: hypothetical protein DWQ10_18230 [Calditrichota bacterium]